MRYLLLLRGDEAAEAALGPAERRAIVDGHIAFYDSLSARGALVAAGPLEGSAAARTVRLTAEGRRRVSDGPFAESKEGLGSFYLVECADLDAALAIAGEVPASPGLAVEVHPVAAM